MSNVESEGQWSYFVCPHEGDRLGKQKPVPGVRQLTPLDARRTTLSLLQVLVAVSAGTTLGEITLYCRAKTNQQEVFLGGLGVKS